MNERLTGISFPFRIKGGVVRASGVEKIKANLRHLLGTRLGERTMLRTYGSGIHKHLQEPDNAMLRALVMHEIEEALRLFMPEIELTRAIRISGAEAMLRVTVEYIINPRSEIQRLELQLPIA
jgi:phage baseplate assembly protein W